MRNCNCRRNCNRNYNNCRNCQMNYCNSSRSSQNRTTPINSSCHCSNMNSNCGCTNNKCSNPFHSNYLYGYAYTPNQELKELFDPQTGLEHGSMFPELVSPYYPGQSMEFIEYLKTTGRNGGCGCE